MAFSCLRFRILCFRLHCWLFVYPSVLCLFSPAAFTTFPNCQSPCFPFLTTFILPAFPWLILLPRRAFGFRSSALVMDPRTAITWCLVQMVVPYSASNFLCRFILVFKASTARALGFSGSQGGSDALTPENGTGQDEPIKRERGREGQAEWEKECRNGIPGGMQEKD